MLKALLAVFRPLYTIARELTTIRELYEMELRERVVYPNALPLPIMRITSKPKKGDVEVTYQGEMGPRWKDIDWLEGDREDFIEDVREHDN